MSDTLQEDAVEALAEVAAEPAVVEVVPEPAVEVAPEPVAEVAPEPAVVDANLMALLEAKALREKILQHKESIQRVINPAAVVSSSARVQTFADVPKQTGKAQLASGLLMRTRMSSTRRKWF